MQPVEVWEAPNGSLEVQFLYNNNIIQLINIGAGIKDAYLIIYAR